jgi:hypothetical protein
MLVRKEDDVLINMEGITESGNWYKGNLHSHTTISDGNFTPEEAVNEFKKHGYSFLCISDHNLYTDYREAFGNQNFLLLPGVEAAAVLYDKDNVSRKVHHMNGILGTADMQQKAPMQYKHMEPVGPFVYYGEWNGRKAAQDMIDELHSRGCFITYNHPIWSRVEAEDFINANGFELIEIFNYNTQNESETGQDTTYWDVMLRQGRHVLADASDDNHNAGVFDDAFGGYIVVKARTLKHDDIVESILSGNYYSSTGPEIYSWGIKDGNAYISCSESERISFIADGFVGSGITFTTGSKKDLLTSASYALTGRETYIRAECRDFYGKKAWTNPIYIEHQGR